DRNKNVEFSLPYFNGGQALVVKNIYLNYYDLEGKKILIEDGGSDNKNKVFEILENFTVIYYYESQGMPYFNKALEEINKGNIDGFVIDYIAAVDAIKKNKNLTILGPFSDEYYGIAVKKENKDLIKKINKILIQLKESGRLDKMKQKWIK
ncbi:MAG: transporter substrate-binding domain-containing protein, partial [Candidatus Woesearchaeota archaeon]